MLDIFLSYAREDQATARRFAEALQRAGFNTWWDQALHPGDAFDQVTERALEEAKAVIVLWSKASVASRWVRAEATQANADNRLVPVMIEPCKRPIMFELTHTAELADWKGNDDDPQWRAFVASLGRFVGGQPASAVAASTPPGGPRRAWSRRAIAIACAALVLAGGLAFMLSGTHRADSVPVAAEVPVTAVPATVRLAVLPLESLSSDPEYAYLSSGLADDLAEQLNHVSGLTALGPDSTRGFSGGNTAPPAIATQLGVDFLVTGTVQRDSSQYKITVRLLNGKNAVQRWGETFRGEPGGIIAIQQEIATKVARALGVVLDVTVPRAQGGTTDVEAFDLYMRVQQRTGAPGVTRESQLELLHQVVKRDANYGDAWFGIYNRLRLQIQGASRVSKESLPGLRKELAEAAGHLAAMPPGSANQELGRAWSAWSRREWATAVEAAKAAAAVAHTSTFNVQLTAAMILQSTGRYREAKDYQRRSDEVSPVKGSQPGAARPTLWPSVAEARKALREVPENIFSVSEIWRDPHWRTDPAFKDLLREVGLVDFWRKYGAGDFCTPRDPDWNDFECQ